MYARHVAVSSDDEVPGAEDAPGSSDDTTAAEAGPPAMDEDRTMRPAQAPVLSPPKSLKQTMPSEGQPRRPSPAFGLAASPKPPVPTPRKGAANAVSLPADDPDGTTETTPRLKRPKLPLSIPGTVEIKNAGGDPDPDDILDETEVRTLPGQPSEPHTPRIIGAALEPPRPAAGRSAADDPRRAAASVPGSKVPSTDRDAPPSIDPPTAPRGTALSADEEYADDEESITTRAPAVDMPDDSITASAPVISAPGIAAAKGLPRPIEDGTEGTTKKVTSKPSDSPADEESESITTQAPGHLTNMLRVIASDGAPSAPSPLEDDDEPLHNKTQVMANAPARPEGRSARAVAAPRLEPTSESGLRVTRVGGSGERASLGLLGVPDAKSAPPSASPPMDAAYAPRDLREVDFGAKKPPYGLIVVAVMTMSIAIPVGLYMFLNQSSDPSPRVTTQPSPDMVGRGVVDARAKAKAPSPSASVSASASASSSSAKPGAKPPRR